MENTKFKILYQRVYFGRVLFVILYKPSNKVVMVYKSSGYNTTESKGSIIPFMFLNSRISPRGECLGYIFKEYLVEGKWKSHRKSFGGKTAELLGEISELVSEVEDTRIEGTVEKDLAENLTREYVEKINLEMRNISKDYEWLDYWKDLE